VGKKRRAEVKLIELDERGKDPDGRRYYRARWTDPTTGKREQPTLGWLTEREAADKRVELQSKLNLGMTTTPSLLTSPTVDDVVARYLADLSKRAGESYQRNEVSRLRHVKEHLGNVRAERLNESALRTYAGQRRSQTTRNGTPTAKSSIAEEISALRRALRFAYDVGHVERAAPRAPSLKAIPDDSRPARRLTEDEVQRIIAKSREVRPYLTNLLLVLAWSGRRPIAIFSARREDCERLIDVALPRSQRLMFWREDKGGVGRGYGPVPEPAYRALLGQYEATSHLPRDARLFTSSTGRGWYVENLWKHFQACADAAGVETTQPYDFRRFAVTQIMRAVRGQIREVMAYTGHTQPETVLRYLYAEHESAESAAEGIGWTPAAALLSVVGAD